MAKQKAETEASGTDAKDGFHWWERAFFLDNMGELLARLEADPSLIPCARVQKGEDGPTIWFYTMSVGKDAQNGDGGDDGGFNNSHNCPPFCPPGGP